MSDVWAYDVSGIKLYKGKSIKFIEGVNYKRPTVVDSHIDILNTIYSIKYL